MLVATRRSIVAACSVLTLAISAFGFAPSAQAQVSLTTLGVASTQNFDTLPATGSATWTNNTTIPGWYHARTGTGTTVVANDGSSNAGNLYSYGTGATTDRALGSLGSGNAAVGNLFWGVRLANNTGATITSLDVSYVGEQWRNSAAAAQTIAVSYLVGSPAVTGSLAEFQSAGVAVTALDFTGPITGGAAAALNGNLAVNRTAISFSISGLSIPVGTEVMLRWSDPDHTGADHGLSIDDVSVTPNGAVVPAGLSINDATVVEGNAGTIIAQFTVLLSAPAPVGGVTFDIATQDNTATVANNDYVARNLTAQTIAAGNTTYTFDVTVNGDLTPETNESFFVNVTNVVGATLGDGQGVGTINNDDVAIIPINQIQGSGPVSPLVSTSVTTTGIVTGLKTNGFFMQTPDAGVDANPLTSEGVFVFTSSAPPAAAALGNSVQVTATVVEFIPTADLLQPPLTELSAPTIVQLSTGNPLPAPVTLTTTFPDPAGAFDQLERVEGMRVSVASMTVVAPTQGNITEAAATATTNGVFFGVVTGIARPFREPGIQAPDPAPGGTIPPIPRFDTNPEGIRVDSDSLVGGVAVNVAVGATINNVTGPLDYGFRHYTIAPDPATPLVPTGGVTPTPAAVPTTQEFTVASANMQRFYDTADDAGTSDVVLTAGAFANRLNKASLLIRDFLRTPDIVGVEEMENLTTLQALAAKISADAIAAGQPDPLYQAFLTEGLDVGGIDVGFLVKTAPVFGTTPRVSVTSVTQVLAGSVLVNPDTSTSVLNDRPPLLLIATVNHPNGASFPITVIANHLRSLNGQDDTAPGGNGWATGGDRVRAKRQKQAEDLANLVQLRQVASATEHILLLGDFNAFEFNDGYGDSMNTITGTPPPDNQTAVTGDGADLVNPDLLNMFASPPPAERYSYSFDGSAQSLDHILINNPLITDTAARRIEHPRVDADFPETSRNSSAVATRTSDHDPVLAYFSVGGFASADLSITKVDTPDPVLAGNNLTYTVTVSNAGPDPAQTAAWTDTLPAGTSFASLVTPAGWSCTFPPVGTGGTINCSNGSFAVGSSVFTLAVTVAPALATGTVISNTATATSVTPDIDIIDRTATATTTVAASADLSVTKVDTPDPVVAGTNLTYTITTTNAGPSNAATVSLSDTLPVGTTFVSLASPGGWSCTTPAVGAGGTVDCGLASMPAGNAVFTLTVAVGAAVAPGTVLTNTATASSTTTDPTPGNNSGTATTTVGAGSADLSATVTDVPDPVLAGQNVTYTITATNAGPANATTASLSDTLPAGTTFVSLTSPGGWTCTTPAVGAGGTVTCSNPSFAVGSAVFTLVAAVSASTPGGTVLSNTATVSSASTDPAPGNESATATTTVTGLPTPAVVSGTKTAAGAGMPGTALTYTIVLGNSGTGTQADNPGNEFTDVLPASLTLVSATATSGTAVATIGTNTVTWNGAIPAGGSVTITISATINAGVAAGTVISNQGTIAYDGDGNGTNEATAVTDNPVTAAPNDPTGTVVGGVTGPVVGVPALSPAGLALLLGFFALIGMWSSRRRVRETYLP